MTDIDPKALALRVAAGLDSDASGINPESDISWTPTMSFTVAEMRALAAFLREAVRGWNFDMSGAPRDATVLIAVVPSEKNPRPLRTKAVHPAYIDEYGQICDCGTWKPDTGLHGEFWTAVAWRPLPTPPAAGGGDGE